jgi:hypothetical protein
MWKPELRLTIYTILRFTIVSTLYIPSLNSLIYNWYIYIYRIANFICCSYYLEGFLVFMACTSSHYIRCDFVDNLNPYLQYVLTYPLQTAHFYILIHCFSVDHLIISGVFLYVCMYIYSSMYMYMYLFMYKHICTYTYTYIYIYIYVCMYVFIYKYMNINIHIYIYICIYICLQLSCCINDLNFCVHYLCHIGWVYVFSV